MCKSSQKAFLCGHVEDSQHLNREPKESYKGKRGFKLVSMRSSGWSLSFLCLLFVSVGVGVGWGLKGGLCEHSENRGLSQHSHYEAHYYTRPSSMEAFDPGTLLVLLHNLRVVNSTLTIVGDDRFFG